MKRTSVIVLWNILLLITKVFSGLVDESLKKGKAKLKENVQLRSAQKVYCQDKHTFKSLFSFKI